MIQLSAMILVLVFLVSSVQCMILKKMCLYFRQSFFKVNVIQVTAQMNFLIMLTFLGPAVVLIVRCNDAVITMLGFI